MASSSQIAGLIIVFDEPAMPTVARLAVRYRWSILEIHAAPQAVSEVLRRRPRLLILQIPLVAHEAVELIHLLRARVRPVPVIAVARLHDEKIERAIREAGASCYLPESGAAAMVEEIVAALVPNGRVPTTAAAGNHRAPHAGRSRWSACGVAKSVLSPSVSRPPTRETAECFPPPSYIGLSGPAFDHDGPNDPVGHNGSGTGPRPSR